MCTKGFWEFVEMHRADFAENGEEAAARIRAAAGEEDISRPNRTAAKLVADEIERAENAKKTKWESIRSWIAIAVSIGAIIIAFCKP